MQIDIRAKDETSSRGVTPASEDRASLTDTTIARPTKRGAQAMNAQQKAVLIVGAIAMVFILLFMDGMNYDGIGAVAAGGFFAVALGIVALRDTTP